MRLGDAGDQFVEQFTQATLGLTLEGVGEFLKGKRSPRRGPLSAGGGSDLSRIDP